MELILKKDNKTLEFVSGSQVLNTGDINLNDDFVQVITVKPETPLSERESLAIVFERDGMDEYTQPLTLLESEGKYTSVIPNGVLSTAGEWEITILRRRYKDTSKEGNFSQIASNTYPLNVEGGVKATDGTPVTAAMVQTLYAKAETTVNDAVQNISKNMRDIAREEIAKYDFIKVVGSLPAEGMPNRIYLIPKTDGNISDLFEMWLWVNKGTEEDPSYVWEFEGIKTGEIELADYVKFTDYATATKAGVVLLDDDALILGVYIDVLNYSIYLGEICGDNTTIDWGDGTINQSKGHEYETDGNYTIKVYNPRLDVDNALYQQDQIIRVKIPKTLTVLRQNFARECKSLKLVELPEGLSTIDKSAFYFCNALETIEIPSTVTSIGQNAFYRNAALTTVIFKSSIPIEYNSLWFNKCNLLKKVLVPNEALDAYKSAWASETRLDAIAYISNMPQPMNFVYKELTANTKYPIKRNGYYMIYCNSANLTLAKKDGTAVVEGAKQMQFMTPPIEGSTSIKACGIYWTGSTLSVEGFRRTTNDGGYVTAITEFFVAEMVKS